MRKTFAENVRVYVQEQARQTVASARSDYLKMAGGVTVVSRVLNKGEVP